MAVTNHNTSADWHVAKYKWEGEIYIQYKPQWGLTILSSFIHIAHQVDEHWRVCLADFGLSSALPRGADHAQWVCDPTIVNNLLLFFYFII